jgi:hypothetical protein
MPYLFFYGYPSGTPIEADNPVSKYVSANQNCVMPFFREIYRNDPSRIHGPKIGARKTYRTGMLSASVCCADRRDLAAITGLKELAMVRKRLAYDGDRRASIQKRSHSAGLWIIKAKRSPSLDNMA